MVIPIEEQMNTYGGAIKFAVYGIIGTLISFLAGLVDGYLRPLKCNK